MNLGIAVLAAGQGTRMKSNLPKVLHPLAGRPLLRHVLATAMELGAARICVVQGPGDGQVSAALAGMRLRMGHAVGTARHGTRPDAGHAHAADMERVLVLYGDIPLIRTETLRKLLATAAKAPLGILTATLEDPSGYGRILRGPNGQVRVLSRPGTPARPNSPSRKSTPASWWPIAPSWTIGYRDWITAMPRASIT
jgi:bifunctional UDP-N-acetylglucosamine pyrophosphorylase/glucosamine-1-phosphate N-acetyltransferase